MTTGVFITEDGYILSCAHSQGAIQGIYVQTYYDDMDMPLLIRHDASLVYEWKEGDLSIYKIKEDGPWPYAKIAKEAPEIGDDVFSIGTTLGFPYYMSWGKTIDHRYYTWGLGLMLHSCSGNMGNSGGPVFNDKGEIVGINVSMFAAISTWAGYVPLVDGLWAVRLTQVEEMIWAVIATNENFQEIVDEFAIAQKHIDEL